MTFIQISTVKHITRAFALSSLGYSHGDQRGFPPCLTVYVSILPVSCCVILLSRFSSFVRMESSEHSFFEWFINDPTNLAVQETCSSLYIRNALLIRLLKILGQPTTGFALLGAHQVGAVPEFPSTLCSSCSSLCSQRTQPTTSDQYTDLQIDLVFTRDPTESLVYDILQLNVVHTDLLIFQMARYSRDRSRRCSRVSVNPMFYLDPKWTDLDKYYRKVFSNLCLAAMSPEGDTRAGILPGCLSLDRGSPEVEVGFEPRTFRSTIGQGSKTLICISFTKLNIHLLLERVFLNFPGYSLTVTQMQANATKRLYKFCNRSHFSRDAERNIRLTESRGLRLPDEPEAEGRDRSWAVVEFPTVEFGSAQSARSPIDSVICS
ncbi:hypothetical protein CSKR_102747 [Clonorchis sinensis]|uniref:Uncharacterized protein n=1 Tax=Clonorchis sinensis TaxID=79923 RepID=A0A3R7FZQ7_CLOSI|nr:hypothetical protein CSKR_102747 [Clonorchis sinensis]